MCRVFGSGILGGCGCPEKEPNPTLGVRGRLLGGSDVQAESRNGQSDDKLGMSVQCTSPGGKRSEAASETEGGEKGAEVAATCSGSLLAWPWELDRVWALSCGVVRGSKEV